MNNEINVSLPIKKVALYKHGMGYFERSKEVDGTNLISLSCSLEEIDDMLKSLMVVNASGTPANITYQSSKPVLERLSEFGFDLKNNNGLLELLGQLKGAGVSLKADNQIIEGRILGVESTKREVDSQVVVDKHLILYSDSQEVARFSLDQISQLKLTDPKLASEVSQQLELIYLAVAKKDKKNLLIRFGESQAGQVTIAYSIPTPIWKTSYRMVFMKDESLLLKGVAIVDNVQDEDWSDVELTLVSANPISFIQPLYEPIKPLRKIVEGQGAPSSNPFITQRGQRSRSKGQLEANEMNASMIEQAQYPSAPHLDALADMSAPGMVGSFGFGGSSGSMSQRLALQAEVSLDVDTSQTGELFEYKVDRPVTIPRDSSSLIDIVSAVVEGERVSLFKEEKNKEFAFGAVLLKNTTGLTLEAGPVTVFEEDSYGGECLLDVVKPDDKRILPYSIDKAVHVITRSKYEQKPIHKVRFLNGILVMLSKQTSNYIYQIENLSKRDKVIYVEHPLKQGWKLASGVEPEDTTQDFYRFRVEVEKQSTSTLEVNTETQTDERVNLTNLSQIDKQFKWLINQNFSNPQFLQFLKRVGTLLSEIEDLKTMIANLQSEIGKQEEAQERARKNVKTLGATASRFQVAIEESEDKIVELNGKIGDLNKNLTAKYQLLKAEAKQEFESIIKEAE